MTISISQILFIILILTLIYGDIPKMYKIIKSFIVKVYKNR